MIKHIIFDLGKVLIGFEPAEYLKSFHLMEEQIQQIIKECFQTDLWNELDRGTYTYGGVADIVGRKCPELDSVIHQVLGKNIYNIFTELESGSAFLRKCIQDGYSCYYLSNFGEEGFRYVKQKFGFFNAFTGGVASYEIHSIKPEEQIYLHLLEKYGLNAKECVFIDDNENNIQAANALGFHGILCTNHRYMEEEFERIVTDVGRCCVC